MEQLVAFIKAAVCRELQNFGENPDDYDIEAVVSWNAIHRGQIIRDFRLLTSQGMSRSKAYQALGDKYCCEPESIRTIVRRHKG